MSKEMIESSDEFGLGERADGKIFKGDHVELTGVDGVVDGSRAEVTSAEYNPDGSFSHVSFKLVDGSGSGSEFADLPASKWQKVVDETEEENSLA